MMPFMVGAVRRRMWAAFRRGWERQAVDSLLEPPERTQPSRYLNFSLVRLISDF